jgi:hypothetical protein
MNENQRLHFPARKLQPVQKIKTTNNTNYLCTLYRVIGQGICFILTATMMHKITKYFKSIILQGISCSIICITSQYNSSISATKLSLEGRRDVY